MKDSHWTDTARVYACVSLHTLCFGQLLGDGPGPLLAVSMSRGELQPLRPVDIEHETGVDRRRVRRAVALLVEWGYLLRDGEKILLWLLPEVSSDEGDDSTSVPRDRVEYPDELPADLKRYLRKFHVSQLPSASVLEQAKPLCATVTDTEAKIRALLQPEKRPSESAVKAGMKRSKTRTVQTSERKAKGVSKQHIQKDLTRLADGVLFERNERQNTIPSSSSSSKNGAMTITAEMEQVSEVLALYCSPERAAVQSLLRNCREQSKDATVATICEAIHLKGRMAGKKDNPLGFLLVAVPNAMNGSPRRVATPEPEREVVICQRCRNTGFIGAGYDCDTIPAARKAVADGAQFCDCEHGALTRDWVRP